MTFAALANKFRIKVDYPISKIELLRDAENDFIEKTLCTETFSEIDTTTRNGGTLTNLYDLPTGFVKEHRVEYDGRKLSPLPQGTNVQIYDSTNTLRTGTPAYYWIENQDIHLVPKPTAHSKIGLWYTGYNTDSSSASPTIPTIEQLKLINYAHAVMLEMDGHEDRAVYYWNKYNADVAAAHLKYDNERYKQGFIIDDSDYYQEFGGHGVYSGSAGGVTTLTEYIWKVTLEDSLTAQSFTTGSGQLSLANLLSGQDELPTFTDPVRVRVTRNWNDRSARVSTESVSAGNVTFSMVLSEFGDGTAAFDVSIVQLSS